MTNAVSGGLALALDSTTARRALRAELQRVAVDVFAPPPVLTVSEWADRHRILSRDAGAAEPGPWRTDRVPYLREIMDSLGDPTVRRVVFKKSSQVGGTECGQNWLGYIIDQSPAPVLVLFPTDTSLKMWSTTRLAALIRDTRCLAARVIDTKERRDSRNTMTRKTFPGGFLAALSAKSSSQLRSFSAPFAIAEEVDEYDPEVNRQGDPLELLERASRTFLRSDAKLYLVSTPTITSLSRIDAEYERSDQRRYLVPCPHCAAMRPLEWRDAHGRYRLVCDRDAAGELVPATARYLCAECGALIEEEQRGAMLAAGEWRATYPGREVRGYHISTLYSPFVGWADIVQKFLDSKRSPDLLKTFLNLWLGLAFEERGGQLEPHALATRAEPYAAEVPPGVGILTAGVDVQADRLEVFVWGFGADEESWVIHWEQLDGDPGQVAVWDELTTWLRKPWKHESGRTLTIAAACVDANYQTDRVHRFCEAHRGARVLPTIGRQGGGRPLLKAPGPRRSSSRRHALASYVVGVDSGKDRLASRLRVTEPGPGYVHFPDTLDPVFYDQLTAETLKTVYVLGRPVRRWVKLEGRRNEALDGAVLALAALAALGPGAARDLAKRAAALAEPIDRATEQPSTAAPRDVLRPRLNNWATMGGRLRP